MWCVLGMTAMLLLIRALVKVGRRRNENDQEVQFRKYSDFKEGNVRLRLYGM